MRAKQLVVTALFAAFSTSTALGQPAADANQDRVFRFSNTGSAQDMQEVAATIRSIADIRQLSADSTQKTLTLRGTTAQAALAEWLFYELDKPASRPAPSPESPTREYRLSDGGEDVVRVFQLQQTKTPQDLQEVATLVRSMTDIRRLFTYTAPKVLALRGTEAQVKFAEWLVNELDRARPAVPPLSQAAAAEHRLSGGGDDVVRVYYLTHARTVQDLQEVATLVRSMADIRRLFTYVGPKAIAIRATAEQASLADWLVGELNKPVGQSTAAQEFRMPGGGDDVVRVFYLAGAKTPHRLQEIATQLRSMTEVRRLFIYNAPRALTLRGTADQIAWADRLIKEWDR